MKRLRLKDLPHAFRRPGGKLGIQPCPGFSSLAGRFTGCDGRQWDLASERRLRPKEAAQDPRLNANHARVLAMIRDGELYPVFRLNARVIEVFACAIEDWWVRQLRLAGKRQ